MGTCRIENKQLDLFREGSDEVACTTEVHRKELVSSLHHGVPCDFLCVPACIFRWRSACARASERVCGWGGGRAVHVWPSWA